MICIIAMVIFGILGLFSVSFRPLAKEAFSCVFKKMTLRKCDTGFDQKMKAGITGKLMNVNPGLAAKVYKHFELLSWTFTIIMFVSLFLTAQAAYNIYVYGTCTPENPGQCVFTPNKTCNSTVTSIDAAVASGAQLNNINLPKLEYF